MNRLSKKNLCIGAILLVTALAAVTFLLWLRPWKSPVQADEPNPLIAAEYPVLPPRPKEKDEYEDEMDYYREAANWEEQIWHQRGLAKGQTDEARAFLAEITSKLLADSGNENRLCSPLGVYAALAAMTGLTDGDGCARLLELVGEADADTLRSRAAALCNACYWDDGEVVSRLDSVLSEGSLVTSFDFQAKWAGYFANREEGQFSAPEGSTDCVYLSQKFSGDYYRGENFGAVTKTLVMGPAYEHSNELWLILPDEGVTVDAVLASDDFGGLVAGGKNWAGREEKVIDLSMPRFEITAQADISAFLDEELPEGLEELIQDVNISVDEVGVSAEGYAYVSGFVSDSPVDVHFDLSRPFIFVLTGPENIPLLAGVVNSPAEGQ